MEGDGLDIGDEFMDFGIDVLAGELGVEGVSGVGVGDF